MIYFPETPSDALVQWRLNFLERRLVEKAEECWDYHDEVLNLKNHLEVMQARLKLQIEKLFHANQ